MEMRGAEQRWASGGGGASPSPGVQARGGSRRFPDARQLPRPGLCELRVSSRPRLWQGCDSRAPAKERRVNTYEVRASVWRTVMTSERSSSLSQCDPTPLYEDIIHSL